MKDGAALACGASIAQGDRLTIEVDAALVNAVAAAGWTEGVGPNYILEATNGAILQSGDADTGCSNSRIVNPAGDVSLMAVNGGDITIRMLSAYGYGTVYAADECTYTVTGNMEVVSHTGFLAADGAELAMPWETTVQSLLPAQATGYGVLEEPTEDTFSVKYMFDDAGDAEARAFLQAISDDTGPDTKDIQVTVTGFAATGNTLQVISIARCERGTCEGYHSSSPPPPEDQVCLTDGVCVESSVVDDATGMMTTTITSDNNAWFGVGFTTPGGGMTGGGNGADIIVCSEEGLRRFWVTGKSNPEDFDSVELVQDAADAAEVKNLCVFEDGTGRMVFTRSLAANSATEREIVEGSPQAIIWARGPGGEQALANRHATRGEVSLDLTDVAGGVTEVKIKGQWTLWLHLLLMAPAWGMILPLGVAIANRARNVEGAPQGAWFKLHKTMQRIGWLLQLFGFIFAVVHCDKYSAHWQHPHTIIGLIVVIIGTLQPVNALLRPHPPQGGWPEGKKPFGRVAFELWHKGFGWAGVILGMVNVILGALLARQLDFNTATWAVPLAIGCTGISAFLLYFVLGLVSPNNAINKSLTGANKAANGQTVQKA